MTTEISTNGEGRELATSSSSKDILPAPEEWKTIWSMAKVLVSSRLLPDSVQTPEAATAIILKGRELNIPPMQAFASINIIKGKPTLSAELMAALVYRAGHSLRVVETTEQRCTVEIQRRNESFIYSQSFTIEDARKAGLTSNQNWQKYPAAMLRARCISAACRVACPDVIMGMYTPEELDETVPVQVTPLQPAQLVPPVYTEIIPEADPEDLSDDIDALALDLKSEYEGAVSMRDVDIIHRKVREHHWSDASYEMLQAAHITATERIKKQRTSHAAEILA